MPDRDTIFAVSSGAPPAAIAIIRVSGSVAFAIAATLAGALPEPRRATLRSLCDPRGGRLLDRALVLAFPAPRTATGEDLVEFHVHGGRAVVAAVEAAIAARPWTRRAEPGEFTRRALENGVIDLTEAEGLGDLLSAQTETQRRAALRMAEGGLRTVIDAWGVRLVGIAARLEAQLDFSDEDDVTEETLEALVMDVLKVEAEIARLLASPPVERLNDGIRVVIAGPPNSGKSTLINALARRDVAIVSSISGTTRDRIEAQVERAGIAYVLTDTAGLTENPGDEIERIGIDRARQAVAGADVTLWLGDEQPTDAMSISVHARSDVTGRAIAPPWADLAISAHTGIGIDRLWTLIETRAADLLPHEDAIATNRRQRDLLEICRSSLADSQAGDPLLVAEAIRSALRLLDQITGQSGTEQVLDSIFANFCIGK